ncbi:hypothetical protein [Clostridium isatidis]|uniref:hypothetical protein n=1 Tax=Clostridium isatidis TaxID=182773 RepID=UPI003AADC4AD
MWISTNYGLSKFEVDKEQFVNFTVNDGLQLLLRVQMGNGVIQQVLNLQLV